MFTLDDLLKQPLPKEKVLFENNEPPLTEAQTRKYIIANAHWAWFVVTHGK